MTKKLPLIFTLAFIVGCAYYEGKSVQDYIDHPKYLVEDPHFESYEDELNAVESQYLQKGITYAEYLEKKKQIDKKYTQEVQSREKIFSQDY